MRVYSSVRASGRRSAAFGRRPAAPRPAPAPTPSTKRPPDSSWTVAAAIAVTVGVRDWSVTTPVPSRTRSVAAPNPVSVVNASRAWISGTKIAS